MLTEKDNYLMTLRGETPEWIPRLLIPSPGHAPATAWVGPGFLNARKTPMGGFDIWGVEYVATKETGYMSLPKPGRFILDDICHWRDVSRLLIFHILTGKPWRKRIWSVLTEHRHP